MGLISGEAVVVVRPGGLLDGLGEPMPAEQLADLRQEVGNVVVFPGATADLDASRPKGARVAYTLCFPKDFSGSLRGCAVEVRGEPFRVVGDPQRHAEANTPGEWNLTVEVERVDG